MITRLYKYFRRNAIIPVSIVIYLFLVIGTSLDIKNVSDDVAVYTIELTTEDMERASELGKTTMEVAVERMALTGLDSIKKLVVKTGKEALLAPEDNTYIKENFTTLGYLDEADCICTTKKVGETIATRSGIEDKDYQQFGGLSGFSSLKELIIPSSA